jgi:hypothetical protein
MTRSQVHDEPRRRDIRIEARDRALHCFIGQEPGRQAKGAFSKDQNKYLIFL